MYLDAFAEALARHWLDPLPDYDRERGTALVTALAIYLEHRGERTVAAAE